MTYSNTSNMGEPEKPQLDLDSGKQEEREGFYDGSGEPKNLILCI